MESTLRLFLWHKDTSNMIQMHIQLLPEFKCTSSYFMLDLIMGRPVRLTRPNPQKKHNPTMRRVMHGPKFSPELRKKTDSTWNNPKINLKPRSDSTQPDPTVSRVRRGPRILTRPPNTNRPMITSHMIQMHKVTSSCVVLSVQEVILCRVK
jgi:hypothetical protein